jgi:hypothetical protein
MIEFLHLPLWANYLIKGILLFAGLASAAVVLTRAGKNPYFAFLAMVPYASIIGIWLLAWQLWRAEKTR